MAAVLVGCIARAPGVIGVAAGHIHRARTAYLGNVPLSTVPCIATDLRREKLAGRPIYHLHTITVTGAGAAITSASILV